jgi:hypothetical protein
VRVRVSRGSTIRVKGNVYSVPARLIGELVEARLGAERIAVWYAGSLVQEMERLRGQAKHRIDYRHISAWLLRKPGAFARYVYREDLYPTLEYRRAYDALVAEQPGRADKEYVRLLHLATEEGERQVAEALQKLLEQRQGVSVQAVRTLLGLETPQAVASRVEVAAVDLRQYDALLEGLNGTDGDIMVSISDTDMSHTGPEKEESDDGRYVGGVAALPAGAAPADGAGAVRGGGAAGEYGSMGLPGLPAGAGGAGVPAAAAEPGRAAAARVEVAAGEELGGAGPEAAAAPGWAAPQKLVQPL